MSERRRFSGSERAALYLAADGRCALCGKQLEPGWHADHERPHSRHGATDVINGQALCPECNLKKGDSMTELRAWQSDALARFLNHNHDFLAVATPGAGKTQFALNAAQRLIQLREIDRVIVIVPTSHLRSQWAAAAAELGIQLDHRFVNASGALARDFDGPVVTYAAVATEPLLYRKLAADRRTLVILDEVHHASEDEHLTWGSSLKQAFEPAARRLLLSGTPFRSDKTPIPFVNYDEAGKCVPDFNYDYGTALLDRDVVRPIQFLALDGSVRWREAGSVVATALVDAEGESLSNALGAALNPDGDWISSVLKRADAELTRHRNEYEVSDAAGLVVAADQAKARRYAVMLEQICREPVTLAISDEPDSSDRIASFARGTSRWIVTVQMVSEGVDIPRLAVGVYASRIRTEMFFRQVVGRFVRMRGVEDDTTSTLLVPSIEPLLRYAQTIQKTVDSALKADEEQIRREAKERDDNETLRLDLVEPLDSSEAVHHSTILAGESFSDEELRRAESVLQSSPGMPQSLTIAQVAHILRAGGAGQVVGTAVVKPQAKPVPLADEKASYRRLIKRKVGRLRHLTDAEYSHIHAQLNQLCGDTAKTATAETLQRRLDILDRWIDSAGEVGTF